MTETIIARQDKLNRNFEFNDLLKRWIEFFDAPTRLLINHLYTKYDAPEKEIAEVLKISRMQINKKYPKKGVVHE